MVGGVIVSLDNEASLRDMHELLGRRHALYGVTAQHFEPFLDAFVWAIADALDVEPSHTIPSTWRTLLQELLAHFKRGLEMGPL